MQLLKNHHPGNFYLLTGSRAYLNQRMQALVIEAALVGRVRLLIGGNYFPLYPISYQLAALTGAYYHILAQHISLSRAETPFVVAELLASTEPSKGITLVTDLLATFEEESVSDTDVHALFYECLKGLQRLAQSTPVIVSAVPGARRRALFEALKRRAASVESPQSRQFQITERRGMPMGHTKPPFTYQYQTEKRHFGEMQRALLRKDDKRLFKTLWDKAEFHIPACEKAAFPLPMVSILMAMNLEQEKTIHQLEMQLEKQAGDIHKLKKELQQQTQLSVYLNGQIENLREDFAEQLAQFREEMIELKYPAYEYAP